MDERLRISIRNGAKLARLLPGFTVVIHEKLGVYITLVLTSVNVVDRKISERFPMLRAGVPIAGGGYTRARRADHIEKNLIGQRRRSGKAPFRHPKEVLRRYGTAALSIVEGWPFDLLTRI